MLALDQIPKDSLQNWQHCALILHAFNLYRGLKCTGFDEDDPMPESGSVLNLPNNFVLSSAEIMTFRYNHDENGEIIMKMIPDDSGKFIDINAIISKKNDTIYSVLIPVRNISDQ